MSNQTRNFIDKIGNIHEIFITLYHDSRPKHPFIIKKLR
jgi:hypothetical protein